MQHASQPKRLANIWHEVKRRFRKIWREIKRSFRKIEHCVKRYLKRQLGRNESDFVSIIQSLQSDLAELRSQMNECIVQVDKRFNDQLVEKQKERQERQR